MTYAYMRVSTSEQNLDRQINAIYEIRPNITEDCIYHDKQSGKDFNRSGYQALKSVLQNGDELIVKELDRLGRTKEGIKEELKWFKEHGVIVRILNVPTTMIDYQGQEWIFDMINNILIEVLGAIAEEERAKINQRREEGIAIARAKGVKFGRRKNDIPANFSNYIERVNSGDITVVAACKELDMTRTQWYRLIKTA